MGGERGLALGPRYPGAAGFALPLVLLCLLVVSLSLTALLALAMMDERGTAARLGVLRAEGDAERNAVMAITAWTLEDLTALPAGSTSAASSGTRVVRRLSSGLFMFSGRGSASPGVERSRTLLLRLEPPPLGLLRALTSPGVVSLAPGAAVTESPLGSRACDWADSSAFGWVPQVTFNGPGEAAAVWAARAEQVLPGGSVILPAPRRSSGTCVATDPSNWGDPGGLTACAGYRPVVRIAGAGTVTGGVGQGVLVVDGDLMVQGGFRFDGLILVGGRLEIAGAGADLRGAVQVDDVGNRGSRIGSSGRITYSTCRLTEMTRRFGNLESIAGGRWHGATK